MAIKWFHPYSAHAKSTDIKVSATKNNNITLSINRDFYNERIKAGRLLAGHDSGMIYLLPSETGFKVSDTKNCGRVYVKFVVKAEEKDNFPKGDFTFKQLTGNGTLIFERDR